MYWRLVNFTVIPKSPLPGTLPFLKDNYTAHIQSRKFCPKCLSSLFLKNCLAFVRNFVYSQLFIAKIQEGSGLY